MIRQSRTAVLTLLAAVAFTGPARADQPTSASPAKKTALDPNERVCRDIPLTGSRMVTRRFCATRAEWEEREREDKDAIQLMQRPMQCSVMGSKRC
jgi:hypothetical protein